MDFHEYVRKLGLDKTAEVYQVSTVTARSWRDLKSAPSPDKAYEIIEKSHSLITWEAIYAPYFEAQKNMEVGVA